MLIGKNYKIESDSLNITLYKRHTAKKNGKEWWSTEGYFSRIQNALKALVDLGVKETDLKDLKTIIKKQNELYSLIEKLKL